MCPERERQREYAAADEMEEKLLTQLVLKRPLLEI
jgi:hypothetical protein